MKRKPKHLYRITRSSEHGYQHMHVELLFNGESHYGDKELCFRWQGDINPAEDSPTRAWYAGRAEIKANNPENLAGMLAVIKQACGKYEGGQWRDLPGPEMVIEALKAAGWRRGVYDRREGGFIAVDDAAPANWKAWNAKDAAGAGLTIVVAESEVAALPKVAKKLAEFPELLNRWLTGGGRIVEMLELAPDLAELCITVVPPSGRMTPTTPHPQRKTP